MDSLLESASLSLGFPIDQLKFVLALLAGYPLAWIHKNLPTPTIKHIFSIISGLFLCIFCLGPLGWVHCFISSTINYLIVKNVKPATSHKVVFFTAPQMVLTIKMTSFAYNYYDGNRPAEQLRPEWKKRAISKLPSLLEWYSYVFFFGGFFGGPAFEIKHYLDFTNKSLFKKTKRAIPSSAVPALNKLIQSFACLVIVVLSNYMPPSYIISEEGLNSGPLYLTAYTAVCMCMCRFKYYFAWLLAEGTCILSGLSYKEDKNGNITWNRLENARVLKTEACQSPRDISTHWNVQTAKWLKNYVYLRQAAPNKRPTDFAMYVTNLTSAFWHGFYPGYYVAFFTASVVIDFARRMRNQVRPYFFENNDPEGKPLPAKKMYDFFGWLLLWVGMGYAQAPFTLLSWQDSYKFMKASYFWLHISLFVSLVVLAVAGSLIRPKKKTEHVQ